MATITNSFGVKRFLSCLAMLFSRGASNGTENDEILGESNYVEGNDRHSLQRSNLA
jgi:hypothetical protein